MSVVIVSHVEKFYGNQGNITQALNDISFAVEKQEFTAVMGASGSGKTTLLNVISTIDAVSAGNIEINGNSICELRENELAEFRKKELGFIFQDFNLLDTLTLQENIALPLTLLKKRAEHWRHCSPGRIKRSRSWKILQSAVMISTKRALT